MVVNRFQQGLTTCECELLNHVTQEDIILSEKKLLAKACDQRASSTKTHENHQHGEREWMEVLTKNLRAKQPRARMKPQKVGKQYDSELRHP